MKITSSIKKNGYPQLIQDCNASTIKEILERVLHPITGKWIIRDPRVIEEGVRITAREKQTRSVHTKRLYTERVQ